MQKCLLVLRKPCALKESLKGHSGRQTFCLVFSQEFWTYLKTNLTEFEGSTTFRFQDMTI